ncbi:major facilitator superfamily domain-containing protein [Talaromyces proteolyticus]|uniref:Major facilitator superfamily domain-containing protein n=1 Tax=Talaromyces proteolyticus TaxID=1131652 RepID=A0AAD4PZY4_9EURO|nr:major facilitator superfamily domain-containing protein [Talaromyces proteolyticus]KAH8696353.1 major facilitator superfamily domain-containing protein [Talaromyces proteolyticus]
MDVKGDCLPNVPDTDTPPTEVPKCANGGEEQAPLSENRPEARSSRDPHMVDWNGPDDPENPTNWTVGKVATTVTIVSTITFLSALSSSIFAPGILQVLQDFESKNSELGSFIVSVFVIGYGFGPLIIAPLSEIYGRLPVYHVCSALFVVFSAACAVAPNLPALVVFRFLAGLAGSCPLALSAGTIADIIPYEKRGKAMAAWTFGPLLGPVIGPIAGGYLIQVKGWRWSFWVVTIAAGVVFIFSVLFMRETYAYAILNRKIKRLCKETGNQHLRSVLDKGISSKKILTTAIIRPSKMLVCSPIIFLFSFYMFIVYGYLYLIFTAMPIIFESKYSFSTGSIGLTYLGLGVGSFAGSFAGVLVSGASSDRLAQHMKAKAGGEPKSEYRLPLVVLGSFMVPTGLFWIGWTAEFRLHWILPIIGTSVLSLGVTLAFMAILTYLVDAYDVYAASAVAASILLRSLGGALLPLAGGPMFSALGIGWESSLLAFIAVAMIPVPILFLKYGERIRQKRLFNVQF